MSRKRVIIIGSGFGGLNATKKLKNADVDILLIDRSNHHLFQPLLYQVASAALSPGDIAVPIRQVFSKQQNVTVYMDDVIAIDKDKKEIRTAIGEIFPYDILIVAIGVNHSYFGNDQWEQFAPGLKTISDAITIRENTLLAFENAERIDNPELRNKFMTFVVVGGGPTGVEMAGAISEIARQSMIKNFRKIRPQDAKIYLIESGSRILATYPPKLSEVAKKDLEKLGVIILENTRVTNITADEIYYQDKIIKTTNVIWAAGNKAPELLKSLNTSYDRVGRVLVLPDMTIPGHPEIFVIGDCCVINGRDGKPLPGVAPTAIQQGAYVANIIKKKIPFEKRKPFKYFDKGSMATIGRAKAVVSLGKFSFSGYFAWLVWCFIHIAYLVNFRSRIIVMTQWMFWYLSGNRNVRLIRKPIEDYKNSNLK